MKNGNFEEGPYVFPTASWGVLIPPNIEDDHSPLPGWMIESLKAVKYIDSDHFAVPEGKRGVELIAGKESALSQVVFTKPNRVYVLSFSVGDANNSCEGSMVVEAFAGLDTVKVPYESKGKGGFKRAKLRFKAISKRTRVMFLSTYYTMKNDNSGSLCGPVLDDVKLLSVRKARVWSGWLWYYSIDYPSTLLLGIHLMYFVVIEIEALISLHLILYNIPVDPAFRLMRFPLDDELDFYLKIWSLLIKKNWLGVATYFCFIFKG